MASIESVDLGSAICRWYGYHKSLFKATSGLERAITCYTQSLTGQTRLVLAVSEVSAGEYGAGKVRERNARGDKRLVG